MSLQPIPVSGMQSLEADELISIDSALIAENCFLDDDTIRPRCGYRAATAAAIGAGQTQFLTRFRPTPGAARTVAGIAGGIRTIVDPSSETTQGTSSLAGTPFGATANLSAAQLGRYLYLATDESGVSWNRMDSSFSLVGLGTLAQGAQSAFTLSSLVVKKFTSLAAPVLSSATQAALFTDWFNVTPTAVGGTITFDLGSDQDLTPYGWIQVFVSPPTQSTGGGSISVALGTNAGTYEVLGQVYDTPGADSPSCVFFPLGGLTGTTRAAVRKVQFQSVDKTNNFAVHGYMLLPLIPTTGGGSTYNITFYNSTTKQESPLSADVIVSYAVQQPTSFWPGYHSVCGHANSFRDESPSLGTNPDTLPAERCFNKGGGKSLPLGNSIGAIPTFTGSIPTTDQNPNADTLRLFRVTSTGRRLVKTGAIAAAQTTYSIVDDQGDLTLTHDLYRPQGTPPRVSALTARAQRLIGAYENRVYISSFVPTSASNDPFPQFPDIPQDVSDGWSFDIAPSNVEQIQWLGNGDALYILSNEAAYVMTALDPNSPPFKVFERGCLGRRAACWAEERLFYAGWDGLYAIANRTFATELSQPVRRMWQNWLAPDATTVVCYQARKLYVICGLRYLRYDFVKARWTRGTLAHTMQHAAMWRDPAGTYSNLWYLASDGNVYRWQPSDVVGSSNAATSDNGTALPAWIYATGFDFTPDKGRIRKLYVDITQGVPGSTSALQLSVHTSMEDVSGRIKEYRRSAHEAPQWADLASYQFRLRLVGIGGAQVRRLLWERIAVSGEGAGTQ